MIVDIMNIAHRSNEPVKILILSDLHLGHRNCDLGTLKRTIAAHRDAYIIGLGDWYDAIIASDVRRYRKAMDGTAGEAILDEQEEMLVSLFDDDDFENRRILGCARGNHEDSILKYGGVDLMARFCKRMNVRYLGYSFLIRLIIRDEHKSTRTVQIRGHHGWGGGCRTLGSVIQKYSHDIKYWNADLFLYGHDHCLHSFSIPRGDIGLHRGKPFHLARDKHVCLCGTYLKTYTEDTAASWGEVLGFPLARIGSPLVTITTRSNARVPVELSVAA